MTRVTVYVDGFNFYYGLRTQKAIDRKWQKSYWIDLVKLFEHFLGENQRLEKVIYFTAFAKVPYSWFNVNAMVIHKKLNSTELGEPKVNKI